MKTDHRAPRVRHAGYENAGAGFHFKSPVVMSPEVFESLPTVEGRPESVIAGRMCKTLISIDGRARWHVAERVSKSGGAFHVAHPIEVRRFVHE